MGSDQEKTFGPEVSGLIKKHLYPDRVTLWDSKARGTRANTVKIIKDIYHAWGAEVVIITTNAQGNKEMTEGLKEAGIPCFVSLSCLFSRSANQIGFREPCGTFRGSLCLRQEETWFDFDVWDARPHPLLPFF